MEQDAGNIKINTFEILSFHGSEVSDIELLGLYAWNTGDINQLSEKTTSSIFIRWTSKSISFIWSTLYAMYY
jgi:hypothetical protein